MENANGADEDSEDGGPVDLESYMDDVKAELASMPDLMDGEDKNESILEEVSQVLGNISEDEEKITPIKNIKKSLDKLFSIEKDVKEGKTKVRDEEPELKPVPMASMEDDQKETTMTDGLEDDGEKETS